jgi:hypothetical protein
VAKESIYPGAPRDIFISDSRILSLVKMYLGATLSLLSLAPWMMQQQIQTILFISELPKEPG